MERALLAIVSAYLLGSIPFAYIVTRWRTGLNIRHVGEGNVGARNVYHVVGARWGTLVGVLDLGKGYAAYLVSQRLGAPYWAVLAAGFAVVLGHGFPIFLRGQGGKGVAVSIAFLLGLSPFSTLAGLGVFVLAHLLLRDFNRSVNVGVAAIILLPSLFERSPWLVVYALSLFLMLAVKKTIDLPHERRVWAQNPWRDGAKPGWHSESSTLKMPETTETTFPIQQQS